MRFLSQCLLLSLAFCAVLWTVSAQTVIGVTRRNQVPEATGRSRWMVNEVHDTWVASSTAIIVVDMWDTHWCPSTVERINSLAVLINQTLNAARQLGVMIIHAPSQTDSYYAGTPARIRALTVPMAPTPMPTAKKYGSSPPTLPIDNNDPGCDIPGYAYTSDVWTHQNDLITIHHDTDYIITDADNNGQTLWNIVNANNRALKNLVYVGVATNLCVITRSFAIQRTSMWNMTNVALGREATDTMYSPLVYPYVEHDFSIELMIGYIEKFYVDSVSIYDFLNPRSS